MRISPLCTRPEKCIAGLAHLHGGSSMRQFVRVLSLVVMALRYGLHAYRSWNWIRDFLDL